jgi:transcriptional regulator with XRE-family HTH domain
MLFHELLNEYIAAIGCSGKELAEISGLSPAMISRYRAGTRVPARESESFCKLAAGVETLAKTANTADISELSVAEALAETLIGFDFDRIAANFNELILTLDLNLSELAREMNYDASYISRIRSRQRRPSDPEAFADGVCRFAAHRRARAADKAAVSMLIGCSPEEIAEERTYYAVLKKWLFSGTAEKPDRIGDFLAKLDEFDLGEYTNSIHFDSIKLPTVPFVLPTSKSYYGIKQMREGELAFLKATVLSQSEESVFMCSDMEMKDMAEDMDFGKKWMLGIAMMLKKGLRLNIIHDIDRPFGEMILGLENWIPIYMTGQISPYYLRGARSGVYCHLNYVSGAAALCGEGIAGYHEKAKYYLTKNRDEIAYYREKATLLMKKAHPLMEIYRSSYEKKYRAFLAADACTDGARHSILSSPPLYTIPEALLIRILDRNSISETDKKSILEYAADLRTLVENVLAANQMLDEIPHFSAGEFSEFPATLRLEGMFYERDVFYTYAEYEEHLNATLEFAREHPNYTADMSMRRTFRNIQIIIHEGKWAMVSKGKSPAVHFVIRQPKLRESLKNFITPALD